jgi:alpha-tubulin suppressor-like RCC1 family protein
MMFPTTEEYPMRRPQIRSISLLVALTVVACQEPTAPAGSPAPAVTATSLVWTQVTVGAQHSCALASNGRAYCWGHAESGQIGTGTTPIQVPRPTRVSGALQFAQISAGTEHTCAVTTDSKAYCWGSNGSGQLGDGTITSRAAPVLVAGGRHFDRIRAGGFHTCALTPAGKAFCWGGNFDGALGDGTTTRRTSPVAVVGGLEMRRLMVGGLHTCAVTSADKAYCWGRGVEGQLGQGAKKNSPRPVAVSGGLAWQAILPGSDHTCGITTAAKAYCWGTFGTDTYSGLGTGNNADGSWTPLPVAGTRSWRQLTAGSLHSCGITLANVPFCWGFNFNGQNGDGTTTIATGSPTRVAGGLSMTGVATGVEVLHAFDDPDAQHSCGITAGGRIYCWGHNLYGQLGTGLSFPDQPKSLVPVQTLMPS